MKRVLMVLAMIVTLAMSATALAEDVVVIGGTQDTASYSDGVPLTPGEKVKESGNYTIEFEGASLRSDDTLRQGCWIGYFRSKDDGKDTLIFEYPIGTHMPVTVNYLFTNMKTTETELLKRVQCQLIYDGKYIFDTVPMQVNPNQVDSKGKTGYASVVGVPVEPLISVNLRFFSAVPIPVRDSDKSLVAVLTIDGTDTYEVNLRDRNAIEIK